MHRYDPRVVWLEDRYYVTWCNGYHGPTIGIGYTFDFEDFHFLENAYLPYNRNGVLFPRKINGKFAMLSRPSDTGHTPFGDIFYSESPDMVHWGKPPLRHGAQSLALGEHQDRRGTDPHRDQRGLAADLSRRADVLQRLRVQHGRGAARPRPALEGDLPRGALPAVAAEALRMRRRRAERRLSRARRCYDPPTGRIAIYYGAADTVTGLAFTHVDELVDFIKTNAEP